MRKQRVVVALVILACGLAGGYLLLSANVLGQPPGESAQETPPGDSPLSSHRRPHPEQPPRAFLPLPPPKQPPNIVPLTHAEQLGKDIVFDHTLSDPPGYACFTCHTPRRATRRRARRSARRSMRSSASPRGSSAADSANASP